MACGLTIDQLDFTRPVGIDPSTTATGYYFDDVVHGVIKKPLAGSWRINLVDKLDAILDPTCPTVAIIESLPRNAMSAGITGQAQGLVRYVLNTYGIPYLELAPATVKKLFAGKGNATKQDMIDQCILHGFNPQDDNVADAYALVHAGRKAITVPPPKGDWLINR